MEDAAPSPVPEASKPSPRPRQPARKPRGLIGVFTALAALFVLAAAAAAYLGVRYHSASTALSAQNAVNTARSSALSSATHYAVDLSSYDYHDLDRGFGTITANSTANFARQYRPLSENLGKLLTSEKAVATGTVLGEAAESVSPDRAVVLLFVDQTVTNTSTTQPQVNHNRMRLTMVNQNGRWLIDAVQLLY